MIDLVYRHVRQNIRAIFALLPLIALTWCIALVAYQGDEMAWASPVFQSPVQPEQPTARPAPEKVLPPTVQHPPPAPVPSPTPPPQPQVQPVQPAQPPQQPVELAPVQQPTQPPAEQQVQPQPPAPPPPAANSGAPSEIVVDSGLLIDSILVYISYAWLCCGVLAFIMIPAVFLVLYVVGIKRANSSEE